MWTDRYNGAMSNCSSGAEAAWFETYLHRELPVSTFMQVKVQEVSNSRVLLSAPLPPNRNDKNTAFGGSLASLLFMAAWGWLFNTLKRLEVGADVVVQDSEIRYRRPTTGQLLACCEPPADDALESFVARLRLRQVARISLSSWVGDRQEPNVTMNGRFVAKMLPDQ